MVNAAGPWSTGLNRLANVGAEFSVNVRPMRQEVHHVTAPARYNDGADLGPAIADVDLGTYMRPGPNNTLLIGGTEPECDGFEWIDDPDSADPRVSLARFEAQVTRAARRLPDLGVPNQPKGVAGVYDVAEDWTPIYDRTTRPASTLQWAPAATSSRTLRWPANSWRPSSTGSRTATIMTAIRSGTSGSTPG